MRRMTLVLTREGGLKLEATASFNDSWDDEKVMEFLVPLMRQQNKAEDGDQFLLKESEDV